MWPPWGDGRGYAGEKISACCLVRFAFNVFVQYVYHLLVSDEQNAIKSQGLCARDWGCGPLDLLASYTCPCRRGVGSFLKFKRATVLSFVLGLRVPGILCGLSQVRLVFTRA